MKPQEKLGAELPAGVKVCSSWLCEISYIDTKREYFHDQVINELYHGMEIELPRDDTISVCFGPTGCKPFDLVCR